MANRQVRNPGQLARFDMTAAIGDAPSFAVNTGQAAEALANVAGSLSDTLGKMAAEAKVKEQAQAGLAYGQQAFDAFQRQTEAVSEAAGIEAGMVRAPGDIRKLVSDAAIKHGVDPGAMLKIAMIESSFNPKAKNPSSSAGGLFQFIDSTAKQYGLTDRYDPAQAADAAARLAKDNSAQLSKVLGRAPNAGELYLAHQQGAGGAAKLLANPGAKAVDIVGADAVRLNGGRADMTAGQFASLWMKKVGGASVDDAPALSKTPLALRRDGTASGDAFDNAALSAFAWRMQEGIATELSAAHLQFPDDPAGYAAAAKEVRDKYSKELPGDPKTREYFDKSFADKNNAFVRDVNANYEKKLRADQEVAYAGGISSMQIELERQAQVLGANPEGDAIIGQQTATIQRSIDGAVSQGIITREQGEKKKLEVAETAARGRIQGVYDALPTPEQKEVFATGILDQWRKREGPMAAMPFATVKALSNTLFNDAREQINRRTATNKAEKVRIDALIEDDVASIAATGRGLDPASSGLDPSKVGEIVGPEGMQKWRLGQDRANRIYAATNGMEVQSTSDLNQRLTLMKPQAGKPGYADELEIYEAARKRAQDVLKERQTDPLGQAARGGAIDIQPIDANSAEELSRTLTLRKTQRDQVAGLYQQQVPVFRPGEKEALSAAILRKPEMLPAFAISIQQAFGNEAPRVLSEISEDGPIIAHAAGLSLASGDTSIANDVADTLANKREKVYTAKMPAQGDMSNFANGEIGGAMYADPRTQSALVQTASILFEQMANQHGFDATDLKTEGSVARAAFSRAIDRAAGARTIGDKTFGGLAEVNGARIIVPSDMEKDQPARLLAGLTPAQMEKLPPIDSSNEFKIPIEKIRQAKLVSVGDGLYRVALNDPLSDDPKYLRAAGGTFWTLNIRQLDEVSKTTRSRDEDLDLTPWMPL